MKNILFILLLALSSLWGYAQKEPEIKISNGEGLKEWTDELSKKQVQDIAKERAIINAIENAFGRVIVQGNATYIENTTNNEMVETVSNFSSISNSTVKGEVIEILDVNYKQFEETIRESSRKKITKIDIRCEVKVKVRELVDQPVEFETFPLNKAEGVLKPVSEFKVGDNFFLYFKSPESGYLSVFNDDQSYTQRLLPYRSMPDGLENGMAIEADREYVFFSRLYEHNYFEDPYFEEDELQLVTDKDVEHNRLFIVFSKEPLDKPVLKDNLNPKLLNDATIKQRFKQPKSMTSEEFQRWKIDNMALRSDMQVKIIDFTILK